MPSHRPTKNEKRRNKKKENGSTGAVPLNLNRKVESESSSDALLDDDITIEYVSADYGNDKDIDESVLSEFMSVFQKITKPEELVGASTSSNQDADSGSKEEEGNKVASDSDNIDGSNDLDQNGEKTLSKRKKKLMNRLSVAELKQLVNRPDVVEAHDVTSSDPRLLVYLKSYRNTVPVPRHWCQIRKYLQGKRGTEKPPFQLPEFIAETGIAKIRESVLELEALKKGKQKARDRMKPKMGKIDIDYQVLHDAFFKYQTKPKLTIHGDLYYEGKEFEVNMTEKKPGVYSSELLAALGMTENSPPPWLVNMQRYGLPPSYPALKVPGVNAPLPPGGQYGYQPGGWGKPPVDEYGRPLYGDVFGTGDQVNEYVEAVDKTMRWGALDPEEEDEEEEDDDDEEEEDEQQVVGGAEGGDAEEQDYGDGIESVATLDGTMSSAPDTVDLRKRSQQGTETPDTAAAQQHKELYHVIREKQNVGGAIASGQMFGSDKTYVLPGKGDVQLSLNPDELEEMMQNTDKLKEAHDEKAELIQAENMKRLMQGGGGGGGGGDVSVSLSTIGGGGTSTQQQKKRKADSASGASKKYKEFKF